MAKQAKENLMKQKEEAKNFKQAQAKVVELEKLVEEMKEQLQERDEYAQSQYSSVGTL